MAIAIYILKMYLFRKQLNKPAAYIKKLKRVVLFIVFLYSTYWFQSSKASECQNQDLIFYRKLLDFPDVEISNQVIKKFELHTW